MFRRESHRRYNPLLDEWVLCSPGRLSRPWRGATETSGTDAPPSYDPDCYMCPGNERANGSKNPAYQAVFVFDNDFPALRAREDAEKPSEQEHPLLRAASEHGICRVVCFSPRHDMALARMPAAAVRGVIDAWADQTEELSRNETIQYVQIFENRGAMMGASNPHPHGQIWAVEHVPSIPVRKGSSFEAYRRRAGGDLLGDYMEEELARDTRVVVVNPHWIVVVPFWAIWPFELMLLPRRFVGTLAELDGSERDALAEILGEVGGRYDSLFATAFPYSMGWYQRPPRDAAQRGFRLHGVYLPPLVRSATVRKFLVGYELTAEPQRDFSPEEAAERLREASR